jgi:hypothetical protein
MMKKTVFILFGLAIILTFSFSLAWPPINPGILGGSSGMGGSKNTAWLNWDEISESGWGDSANTFICLFDGSGNETGIGGGLAGTDLILTNYGVPAATGSPPSRHFTIGNAQYFEMIPTATKALLGSGNKWTIITKCYNPTVGSNNSGIFSFGDADNHVEMNLSGYMVTVVINSSIRISYPWNDLAELYSAKYVWIAAWSDGLIVCTGVYTGTNQPTKKSQFQKIGTWTGNGDMSGMGAAPTYKYMGRSIDGHYADGDYFYLIMSKSCLIDNAS